MIHVDGYYFLMASLAVFFGVVLAVVLAALAGSEPKELLSDVGEPMTGGLAAILLLLVIAELLTVGVCAYYSGTVYHPCVVENFETMKMRCK